eukprot:scaffold420_cov169-Ochromonas_danica.AAC.3
MDDSSVESISTNKINRKQQNVPKKKKKKVHLVKPLPPQTMTKKHSTSNSRKVIEKVPVEVLLERTLSSLTVPPTITLPEAKLFPRESLGELDMDSILHGGSLGDESQRSSLSSGRILLHQLPRLLQSSDWLTSSTNASMTSASASGDFSSATSLHSVVSMKDLIRQLEHSTIASVEGSGGSARGSARGGSLAESLHDYVTPLNELSPIHLSWDHKATSAYPTQSSSLEPRINLKQINEYVNNDKYKN